MPTIAQQSLVTLLPSERALHHAGADASTSCADRRPKDAAFLQLVTRYGDIVSPGPASVRALRHRMASSETMLSSAVAIR